ncbi:C2 calcium-dependent membrane targeting [Artemisia annua]|uniref:C2 calcium-dependent membrane targeting n=1 Tax=Artemisia annua TaxID=35608 RepID=A0A2U1LNS1_ARTAN|nr:C2 calcium-dependent membrane targeting [Artemisia annua]
MNFTIYEAAGLENRLTLVVKIKSVGMFSDKNLGEVLVPMKELLEGIKDEGKAMQLVSYQVKGKSKKPRGSVSFSYKFGEKFFKASSHGFGTGSKSVSQPRKSSSSSGCADCCCWNTGDVVFDADAGHHGGGCGGCACGGCDCDGCSCGCV